MSEETTAISNQSSRPEAQGGKAPPNTGKRTNSKRGSPLAAICLILLLVAIGVGGYFANDTWQQQKQNAQAINLLKEQLSSYGKTQQRLSQTNKELSQLAETSDKVVTDKLAEQTQRITDFEEQLNAIKGSTRKDWLLAEAEYLLRVANQRLLIEQDPIASESLLEAADEVLAEINDSALMPVRIQLAEELMQLRSMARGQVETLLLRLSAISNQLATLEFTQQLDASEIKPSASSMVSKEHDISDSSTLPWWQRLFNKIELALSKAISIQRTDERQTPPPSPEASAYLKQNLALRIEQIKLLLMRNRFDEFEQSLNASIAWSKESLPIQQASISALIGEMEKIKQARPQSLTMDISGSLELLREKIALKYRTHEVDKLSSPAKLEELEQNRAAESALSEDSTEEKNSSQESGKAL